MFMQCLKNKKLLVFAILVSLTCVVLGQQKQKTGNLVGTAVFVSEDGRTSIKFSPKTSIVLISGNKKKIVISDKEGDYLPELLIGKYCISSVENEDGTKLKLWTGQHKCFKIYRNKTTRFDISLLMP